MIGGLVVLVILSAFFSGSETALMSISSFKIRHLVTKKVRGAETLHKLKQRPHRLLVTLLIGNNIVNIAASTLAAVVTTELLGSMGAGVAVGVMTFIILIFGELTPKTLAMRYAEQISLTVAPLIRALSAILFPLVVFFEVIAKAITRLFGRGGGDKLTVEELKTIVAVGHEEGVIDKKLAKIMKNVLEFRDTKASDVMTPVDKIRTVKSGGTIADVIRYVNRTPYSRYPIRKGSKIVGILDVDDVLRVVSTKGTKVIIDDFMRSAKTVDGETAIDDLFVAFEKKNLHMLAITDKNGKVVGIVTLDDILEEIVGEIFDKSSHKMRIELKGDELKLDAGVSVKAMNRALSLHVKSEHFKTIAGLLEHKLGRKPRRGDVIFIGKKVRIKVTSADKRGADRVKISRV